MTNRKQHALTNVLRIGSLLLLGPTIAFSQWCEQAKLVPCESPGANGPFDVTIRTAAIDGDWLVQGVEGDDYPDPCDYNYDAGSALVYRRNGTTWTLAAELRSPSPTRGERFGRAVAVSGDRILVGAQGGHPGADNSPQDTVGAGYVFAYANGAWNWEATLLDPFDPEAGDHFGNAVALEGDYAVIGARGDDANTNGLPDNSGSVFVYFRDPVQGWQWQQRIRPPGSAAYDWFGWSVDIEGDRIAVGAPRKSTSCPTLWPGMAFVFLRSGTTWNTEAALEGSTCHAGNSYFGSAVSLSGNLLAVGAPLYGTANQNIGEIYIFQRSGSSWSSCSVLGPPVPLPGTEFGQFLKLSGGTLAVSNLNGGSGGTGLVWIYTGNCAGWSLSSTIIPSGSAAGDQFGACLDLSGQSLAVNAPGDDDAGRDMGSTYVVDLLGAGCGFAVETCPRGTPFGFGDGTSGNCPCGNNNHSGGGCMNSTSAGARLNGTAGSTSVSTDDLEMSAICVPKNQMGLFFQGPNITAIPFGDGIRCVGGSLYRYNPPQTSGPLGQLTLGPGIVARSQSFATNGRINAGATWYFQAWYRDPMGSPCGYFYNVSNGLSVTFQP